MATLYVYALTDQPLDAWREGNRSIRSIAVEDIVVVGERRVSAPSLSEEGLRRQHAIVLKIAQTVPAVLPARFGSLLDFEELSQVIRQRSDTFREALTHVRNRVQMTIRLSVSPPSSTSSSVRSSGREYLQQRLAATSPRLPGAAVALLEDVGPTVIDERRRINSAGVLTIYHLVERNDALRYQKIASKVRSGGVSVTGPWPPFAFVPELWP